MALVKGKFIEDNAVSGDKFRLDNDQFLKGRNAADNADVNIIKVTGTDTLELAAKLSDPDSSAPTSDAQLANKKYVDDQVATISVPTVFELQGNWNASTNTPTLDNTDTGVANYLYYVNVAGSVDFGAGSITFAVGDWVYNVNGAWEKADNNDDVLSVNSQTGAVVLDSDDISEGASNFYYTESRFDTSLATKDTGDLAEGSNLYFTEQRVQDSILSDYVVGADAAIANTDAIDEAFGKVQGQINALATASTDADTEIFTLNATDISNGYVDLAFEASEVLSVTPVGGLKQEEGVDYTLSVVSTVTRVTFAGDLSSLLADGDKLMITYLY